ncbi:MAG: 2-C-methyl-D-erythritol 4-phosphate cytidylyltransferase [Bacilli bacterium]|nr:2-C-methyl-D-erythritol 4-phosphate cytidylyltransferase [Bacilli bacterium]
MNYALLLLAGSSKRFKQKTPKQFYLINGRPLYYYPLKALEASEDIDGIILLTNEDKVMEVYNFTNANHIQKIKAVIAGGASRNDTVKFGLNKLQEFIHDDDIVLIHDAARALLDKETIHTAISETKIKGATTFALRVYDTLVRAYPNYQVKEYVSRLDTFYLQTPQTFKYGLIKEAYQKNNGPTFDDTEIVYRLKKPVHLLKGKEHLFKVTRSEDVNKVMEALK